MELLANFRLPVVDMVWKGIYGDGTINSALYGELQTNMQYDVLGDMAPQSKTMSSFDIPDDCCYLYDLKDFGGEKYKACLQW